jgi:hypothetical protein
MNQELLNHKIVDRQTFSDFIKMLRQDFIKNPNDWQNKTLPDFLEAMSSYVEDIQGYYDNTNQKINADIASWKVFADIFHGAKIYE